MSYPYLFDWIAPTAVSDCKLRAIERQCFQKIMMRSGIIRQEEYKDFLKRYDSKPSSLFDEVGIVGSTTPPGS